MIDALYPLTYKQPGFLTEAPDAGIANNTYAHACSKTRETNGYTSKKLTGTSEKRVFRLKILVGWGLNICGYNDGNNKTIDADDTSHNYRNQSFHHLTRVVHTHASYTDTTLARAIGSADAGKNDCECRAGKSKQRSSGRALDRI